MPNELANLMFIAVNGKKIAEDKVSHVKIEAQFEMRDLATVTVTDSEFKGNEYKVGDHLEVRLQSKDYGNAHLFDGQIVTLTPKSEPDRIKAVTIRAMSPKRVWQLPTLNGKEIPLQVPKSRVQGLILSVVPPFHTTYVPGWDPVPLVREPQWISRAPRAGKDKSLLRIELEIASPSAKETVSYSLDQYLQINVEHQVFKNPRGIVRGVTISADRERNTVKLILDLRGPADNL